MFSDVPFLIGGRSCKREKWKNHGCDPRNPGDIFLLVFL